MKLVILAGGLGTRLSEMTDIVPKPMVEVGGHPMLWHIMKLYAHHGITEFVIALGYKGEVVKDYFINYHLRKSDCTVDLNTGVTDLHGGRHSENWRITLVDTGSDVMTGGRILRLREHLEGKPFMLTYGDGIADIDVRSLFEFHCKSKTKATLTAVHPKTHYGELEIEDEVVVNFVEKPEFRQSWINGGFMVLENSVIDLIEGDKTVFEREPLEQLTATQELSAYRHDGFWQCMDTLRDVNYLNALWNEGQPPWRVW